MRRRTLRVKKEPTIMIIPMIDIVFFLLVFFMVGTLYMNTEQQIPLNLPSASTSTAKSIGAYYDYAHHNAHAIYRQSGNLF